MKITGMVVLSALLCSLPAFPQGFIEAIREMPTAGNVRGEDAREYSLTLDLGLEQWEGEQKSRYRYQLWYLTCTSPQPSYTPPNNFDTFCNLERTVFTLWSLDAITKPSAITMPSTVTVIDNSTSDGTLRIRRVDWEKGILELSAMHTGAFDPEGSKIDISIRLEYIDDTLPNHSTIFVRSLKAIDIAYGILPDSEVAVLEYRVPEYSYFLEAPFEIKGFKSREEKEMDDLARSLTTNSVLLLGSTVEGLSRQSFYSTSSTLVHGRIWPSIK